MNEEEKKAIEYSKNCLMKITLGIDCEFDVNILDTLLNTIKKLQKENEDLKANCISIQKVKDKIEEYKACGIEEGDYHIFQQEINALEELLREE